MARKMDIPDPIYQWLLRLKGELSVARGRNVTYPEVWEHVKEEYEVLGGEFSGMEKADR